MLHRVIVRARALLRRAATEAELDEELSYHLDRDAERRAAAGATPNDARLAARRAFGNPGYLKEQVRDSWGLRWLDHLGQDVRFALRGFRRSPAFVVTVVLTIALALGLNTSVFTIFNAYVLRPLAVRDGGSLFEVFLPRRLSWRQFNDLRQLPVASEGFAYSIAFVRSEVRPMFGSAVTSNALDVLGGVPALGRLFVPGDDAPPSGQPVVVLSYDAWQAKFGADTAIIGKTVRVRGTALTVVGVTAPRFTGIGSVPPDFWVPVTLLGRLNGSDELYGPREPGVLRPVIRLAPGVSEGQALAAIEAWERRETANLPDSLQWKRAELVSVASALPITDETIAIFAPAAVAFLLVLLIACANVANVMLARGVARQREIGIRLALGAGRRRLVRQLLTESVLLALPAAALGFVVASWSIDASVRVLFSSAPSEFAPYLRTMPMAPDLRVFAFVLVAAVTSALAFGLAPALQATRPDVARAARGEFDAAAGASRMRGGLVVAQIGVCSLLLIVTGVLLRGAEAANRLETGMRTHDVMQLALDDRARVPAIAHLRTTPIVSAIGASTQMPLDGSYPSVGVRPAGERRIETPAVDFVDAGFFRVLDIDVFRGRTFTDAEERQTSPVVIVSEAAAATLWPGRDPLGEVVQLTADPKPGSRLSRVRTARVVGVSRNAVSGWLGTGRDRPVLYYPASADSAGTNIVARVVGDALAARDRIERDLSVVDERAVYETHTLDGLLAGQRWPYQLFSWIASAIGAIALVLTLIGTYGVLSYLVAQRSREIGIRMALGATITAVVGLVLRQSLRYAAVGLVAGTVIALGVSKLFGTVLVIVNAFDPVGYGIGIGTVLAACVVAALAPSRRAAKVDPLTALRAE